MIRILVCVLSMIATQAFAAKWEESNGILRLTFGLNYEYDDDFILTKGRLGENDWIYDEQSPVLRRLVATRALESFGTDKARRYTLAAVVRIKASWQGTCEMVEIGDNIFSLKLHFHGKSETYEAKLVNLPYWYCDKDTGEAVASTENRYWHFGIPVKTYEHIGKLKNIYISLSGVTRNTSLAMEYAQLVFGSGNLEAGWPYYPNSDEIVILEPKVLVQ